MYSEMYEVAVTGTASDPVVGESTTNTPNSCVELENGYTLDLAMTSATAGVLTFQGQTAAGCPEPSLASVSGYTFTLGEYGVSGGEPQEMR